MGDGSSMTLCWNFLLYVLESTELMGDGSMVTLRWSFLLYVLASTGIFKLVCAWVLV